MSRLPGLTAREMVAALKRAGFDLHHQKGSHLYLWNSQRQIMTSVPQHARDLSRPLMKEIIKQARLNEAEFREFL